nr:hypothetical protein [Tanacetum cinerariifolium]
LLTKTSRDGRGSSRGWREAEAYVRYYSKNAPIKLRAAVPEVSTADNHNLVGPV